jgi:hypothetical protein
MTWEPPSSSKGNIQGTTGYEFQTGLSWTMYIVNPSYVRIRRNMEKKKKNLSRFLVNTDSNQLTLWSRAFLETLLDTKLVNKLHVFRFLLQHSPPLKLCSEPDESSSHRHALFMMQHLRPSLLLSGLFLIPSPLKFHMYFSSLPCVPNVPPIPY